MEQSQFWREVFAIRGSVTPYIRHRLLWFITFSCLVWAVAAYLGIQTGMAVAPYEIVGVVLALLLVLRTNSGYDRWYEGRKLWGGIVNQSRNLATIGLVYGPDDRAWRETFARWVASFSHVARHNLRGERDLSDMGGLLGDETDRVAAAQHMPMYVAGRVGQMLREALEQGRLDRFAFIQAEKERAELIDHIGACERILKTPLAQVFSIKIRRFLFIYLTALPLAIVDKAGVTTPLITLLVAYPLLSLDQIGIELQNPFSKRRLSHLPLEDICHTIESNVMAYLEQPRDEPQPALQCEPTRALPELVA